MNGALVCALFGHRIRAPKPWCRCTRCGYRMMMR